MAIHLINKPRGITSYDVIRDMKKKYPGEKIGHGGTLDPLAEGLLIVAVGKEFTSQLATILNNSEKEYEVILKLGEESTTDDGEGEVAIVSDKIPSLNEIEEVVGKFVGEIMQTPPIHSAIKIGGLPAYVRARRGEQVEMPVKQVTIYSIKIFDYTYPELKLQVVCGSGVYIRALARDIGRAVGVGAYVTFLKRTRVGQFTLP